MRVAHRAMWPPHAFVEHGRSGASWDGSQGLFGALAPRVCCYMIAAVPGGLQLDPRDRLLGYEMLRLVGSWPSWVHRRVESVTYETAHSVRRRVSVDLRLADDYFSTPYFQWDGHGIHYVPVALLNKQRLGRFDVRDERGGALPVMTRSKTAVLAAAMLSALAQAVVADRARRMNVTAIAGAEAVDLQIPDGLEDRLLDLTLPFDLRRGQPDPYDGFVPANPRDVGDVDTWTWWQADGKWHSDATEEQWRWRLCQDAEFARFAWDVSHLFIICVPLKHQPGRRRIVKFAYSHYLDRPQSGAAARIKDSLARAKVAGMWNRIEDAIEQVPSIGSEGVEWLPSPEDESGGARQPAPNAFSRLLQGIGLATKPVEVRAPAVAHGASYHMNFTVPDGVQIRHAQLIRTSRTGRSPQPAVRGVSSVQSVDLYATGVRSDESATAQLRIKPCSSLLVRAGALSGVLVAVTMILALHYAPQLERSPAATQSAAAVLVVVPGLLAAYVSRDAEHPLATSMLFGLRLTAMLPAIGSLLMAGLLILGKGRTPAAYGVGIAVSVVAFLLLAAWRLAARGQPHVKVR